MTRKPLAEKATDLVTERHLVKHALVVDSAEAVDPKSGDAVHRFKVVSGENANGASHTIFLNSRGDELQPAIEVQRILNRTVLVAGPPTRVDRITIQPDSNVLTLSPGQTVDETITVTIPKSAGSSKADVYFLADTTGSMGSILSAVQAGANNVLSSLSALGVDMQFGVGNYKDFASGDPYGFQHQLSPTNVTAAITSAINAWSASGGTDTPEAALFALESLAVPAGPGIGWRPGSKRIIVWFGDAPSHDPICTGVSGAPTVTEASATGKLVTENITVVAISTANPGLDDDPKLGATGYIPQCGPPGGLAGQATRITSATGGTIATGINAGNIVNTIINLVQSAVGAIQNVKLVPSPSLAAIISSITPAGGYGPLAGDQDHTLTFDVKLVGVPCTAREQVITGSIEVVVDGAEVATKKVQITVPPCRFVYSVKFICGVQPDCECGCISLERGIYATAINIHNYSLKPAEILKRFVPVILAGVPVAREPRVGGIHATDKIVLPPQTATMDDCCRIGELILGNEPQKLLPLTVGFLELTTTVDVAVTAVYTASGLKGHQGVSIEVKSVPAHR